MSAAYRHCVIGLLTSIVWTLIGRLDDVYITDIVYLGIPGFPLGMPYGFVRIIYLFFFLFFLFFRRQGFRMITFDRQAGPLQNFNRPHVMVIGRSVSFSDPARPPGGGVGRPKHPKIPPPPPEK